MVDQERVAQALQPNIRSQRPCEEECADRAFWGEDTRAPTRVSGPESLGSYWVETVLGHTHCVE